MRTAVPFTALLSLLALAAAACSGEGGAATPNGKPPAAAPTAAAPTEAAPTTTAAAQPAATGAASAAAPPAKPGPPSKLNVLMISVDSMRADMPWNGYERDIAPVMTAFEKTAVSYTRHYSISSYTSMSLGGFLAGRYPGEVERSGYFFGNYPDSVVMFPELLQKAGVRTVSAQAHFYFEKKAGFQQGFDVYEMVPGLSADNTTDRNVTAPKHTEIAIKLLSDKANTGGTFFAWFHFLDPHDVYMRHPDIPSFGKHGRDLYDGEIRFTDEHIGKLLEFVDKQPWADRTAIILTSDHGEAFGEHRMYRHGFELWENLVHVPLMIRAPGIKPRRIDALRSSIDLAPTILELTGAPAEPSLRGTSLVPELYGAAPPERDVIIDLPRTSDNDRRRAVIRGQYKLIAYGDDDGYRLFDVIADPEEKKDLKRKKKDVFKQMKALYKDLSSSLHDVCPKQTHKLKGKKKHKPC